MHVKNSKSRCDVLLISNLYPPYQIGGYEIAAYDVAECLKRKGMNVSVLTSDYAINDDCDNEPDVMRDLKLTASWFDNYIIDNKIRNMHYNYFVTDYFIKKLKPSVVYAWNQANLGGGVISAAYDNNIEVLHHIMGYDILSYFNEPISNFRSLASAGKKIIKSLVNTQKLPYQLNSRHFKNIIFISEHMQNHFRMKKIKPNMSEVIYPGIPVNSIPVKNDLSMQGEVVNFVYLGQLAAHKGLLSLITALNEVKSSFSDKEIVLHLLGNGDEGFVKELFNLSKNKLVFEGFMEREWVYSKLSNYDIGVFPSLWDEPFGIAQIELMAAGLPVISSGAGGSAEPLIDGENSIVYNRNIPGDFSSKILDFLKHYKNSAPYISRNARLTCEQKFDIAGMEESIYQKLRLLM